MSAETRLRIRQRAQECVDEMGDIFWDYDSNRDATGGYADPYEVAVAAVERLLSEPAEELEIGTVYTPALRDEYMSITSKLPSPPDDNELVRALVSRADWTEPGARAVVALARQYGTSVLRSALALAETLGIDDGRSGM